MAYVLFIDIVGYSRFPLDEQRAMTAMCKRIDINDNPKLPPAQ